MHFQVLHQGIYIKLNRSSTYGHSLNIVFIVTREVRTKQKFESFLRQIKEESWTSQILKLISRQYETYKE